MQTDITIRRRADGTIDIESYGREALKLRAQVRADLFRRAGRLALSCPVLAAAGLAASYFIMQPVLAPAPAAAADVPAAIAARGETLVATAHAVGAQVYECKFDTAGNLIWQFREPIATMFVAGKTVGRHYAGPHWEMTDGSTVSGKIAARAPGAGPRDIPLLKLEAASWHGKGQLSDVTTIQRLNTRGGNADETCDSYGAFLSVPYTADYAFYRKDD